MHCHPQETVAEAIALLGEFRVSQMPVFSEEVHDDPREGDVIGSVRENALLDAALRDADIMGRPVIEVMQPPLPTAASTDPIDGVAASLSSGSPAVIVCDDGRPVGVLTRADLLTFLAERQS